MDKTERYYNDPVYHSIVDVLYNLICECQLTPSEIRDAAMCACIKYEMNHVRFFVGKPQEAADEKK